MLVWETSVMATLSQTATAREDKTSLCCGDPALAKKKSPISSTFQ